MSEQAVSINLKIDLSQKYFIPRQNQADSQEEQTSLLLETFNGRYYISLCISMSVGPFPKIQNAQKMIRHVLLKI